jgi:hypothetical protein
MTYAEILATLKNLSPAQLATEAFVFEPGANEDRPIAWINSLGLDEDCRPEFRGTSDVNG